MSRSTTEDRAPDPATRSRARRPPPRRPSPSPSSKRSPTTRPAPTTTSRHRPGADPSASCGHRSPHPTPPASPPHPGTRDVPRRRWPPRVGRHPPAARARRRHRGATRRKAVVTVTGDGPTVAVTWRDDQHPTARATRAVLLEGSSARFARFARSSPPPAPAPSSSTTGPCPPPGSRTCAPTVPGPTAAPACSPAPCGGSSGATTDPAPTGRGADLVTRLERLAALHRAGDLTDTEYARAKQALLG